MKTVLSLLLTVITMNSVAEGQTINRDVPYAEPAVERQVLDIYAPKDAKSLPVVFWIHGGGWQVGDKSDVNLKPQAFMDRGFVFVSTNYRLLPHVDMGTLTRDVAKSCGWVHKHIADYGGDPNRIFVMGHSAGAQLAALLCTDEVYLKAEGVPFSVLKGCVPVDGDTYDIPAIIELAETRWRLHGQARAKFGHREKFGNDPALHKDFSAVTHVAKGKGIPPFLIMYVSSHPDTSAQANWLGDVLKKSDIPVQMYGGRDTNHSKLNDDIGIPEDPGSKALSEFVADSLKR